MPMMRRSKTKFWTCLDTIEEEIGNLVAAQKKMKEFLDENGMSDFGDYDAFFDLFYDEDIRYKFIVLYKEYTKALNAVFPRKEALDYLKDYNILTEINVMAGRHFHDSRLSMKGIPEKLRAIADAHLKEKGIDVKIEPISIINPKFEEQLGARKRTKTKAAEIEHAIRHHIEENEDDDPELYAGVLRDAGAHPRRGEEQLGSDLPEARSAPPKNKGCRERNRPTDCTEKSRCRSSAFCAKSCLATLRLSEDQISGLVALTKDLYELIEREITLTGFWNSAPARNKLQGEIQKHSALQGLCRACPASCKKRKEIIPRLMELAETKNDTILVRRLMDMEYEVIFSDRKTLGLTVERDGRSSSARRRGQAGTH